MNDSLKIQYTIDVKDYVNFKFTNIISEKYRVFGYVIAAVVLFSILSNSWLWKLMAGQSVEWSDFTSVFFIALLIGLMNYIFRKEYNSSQVFQNLMHIEVSKEDVVFEGEGYNSKLQWSLIHKVVEKKNYFVIFPQKKIGNIISKSNLSQEEINGLKSIFSSIEGLSYSPRK